VKRLVLACALLAIVPLGCRNERAEALQAELAKLKEERVETAAVEKARADADAEASAIAAARSELEAVRTDLAAREAERDRLRGAIEAEAQRAEHLQAEIAAVGARAIAAAQRGQELDADLARVRTRAAWAHDQADVLAREIRPGDPAWATARRLGALADFAGRLAQEYPGDPTVVAIAHEAVRAEQPTRAQAEAAAAQAAALRDRFASVYELEPPAVAAAPETTP